MTVSCTYREIVTLREETINPVLRKIDLRTFSLYTACSRVGCGSSRIIVHLVLSIDKVEYSNPAGVYGAGACLHC